MADSHLKVPSVSSESAAYSVCGLGLSEEKGLGGFGPGYLCISGLMRDVFGESRGV